MERGFVVVSSEGRVALVRCGECGAVLTPDYGERLDDVLELHASWHQVMRETAFEVREELRELGFELRDAGL